jgi:hypothetical protein
MTPDTYGFNGDAITFLGLLGVASTLLIVITAFRSFYNSPYNIRVTPKVTEETSTETTES